MKIGISTACFFNRCETEDALNLISQTGAETCEVYLNTFYEYRPEFAKKYAERLNGVKVHCVRVAPCNFEPNLSSGNRRVRGDGFYWLDQVMRSAQLFGAENFAFHGQGGGDNLDYTAWWLGEASDFCARYGVKLCLENSLSGTYASPALFKQLKARAPQLCGALNLTFARASGYPYQMFVKDMAGAISCVHIADVDENGNPCLPGKGVYDFKEFFKVLKNEGFDGAVIIDTTNFNDVEEIKTSVGYLKSLI